MRLPRAGGAGARAGPFTQIGTHTASQRRRSERTSAPLDNDAVHRTTALLRRIPCLMAQPRPVLSNDGFVQTSGRGTEGALRTAGPVTRTAQQPMLRRLNRYTSPKR